MSNKLPGAFLVACGLLAAGAAAAQNAANSSATSTSNSNAEAAQDSGAASAASTGASPAELQEVVVTARHRAENLQNVPLTDTAVTAKSIQTWNVTNLEDLNSFVPNMKISADRATSSGDPPIEPANSFIGGISQIGFYGPPRTYSATVTYHY